MDILTLGKMNEMAKSNNVALELMANHVYDALSDINTVQDGNVNCVNSVIQAGVDELTEMGDSYSTGTENVLYIGCRKHDGTVGQESINYDGTPCQWTVPEDVKGIKFEIYGGGASGYGGCCCMMNPLPGGGGAYAVKHINRTDGHFTPGDVYSLCAGGTGCCYSGDHGNRGHTSYVTGPGLSNFCAVGGHPGSNGCRHWNCYTCCQTCYGCAPMYGADYGQSGKTSWRKGSQHCASSMFQVAANGAGPLSPGEAFSQGGCKFGYHSGGSPASPGGGAFGGQVSGTCCCGKAGGGGAVLVTYWK